MGGVCVHLHSLPPSCLATSFFNLLLASVCTHAPSVILCVCCAILSYPVLCCTAELNRHQLQRHDADEVCGHRHHCGTLGTRHTARHTSSLLWHTVYTAHSTAHTRHTAHVTGCVCVPCPDRHRGERGRRRQPHELACGIHGTHTAYTQRTTQHTAQHTSTQRTTQHSSTAHSTQRRTQLTFHSAHTAHTARTQHSTQHSTHTAQHTHGSTAHGTHGTRHTAQGTRGG